jgi:hypothetical protein
METENAQERAGRPPHDQRGRISPETFGVDAEQDAGTAGRPAVREGREAPRPLSPKELDAWEGAQLRRGTW